MLSFLFQGHPDEHEGEGHLPGEGSGQEPEGHEGAVNTTAERSGKEHYKGDLKNSSSILPSEAPCFIQPSSVLVIVPTSSSSAMESVTEPNRGHSSMNVHQLAQTPISVSMSLSPGNSQMVLQNSFSTDTFGLVSESPIFSHSSFSTPKLASLCMTESSVPHISTSLEYPQSRMPQNHQFIVTHWLLIAFRQNLCQVL